MLNNFDIWKAKANDFVKVCSFYSLQSFCSCQSELVEYLHQKGFSLLSGLETKNGASYCLLRGAGI
ncbi:MULTISPECIES: hypothetical protein [Pedobacter]|uniref:hypothetical protein n=1 Tax=Pedobacter TaxID=84567 RepID=UPI001E64C0EA|nr:MULTISPECIES: hypothetical protein [Pedobacter]